MFFSSVNLKTRPDTRPSVAYIWAGAVVLKNRRKSYFQESVTNGPTDRRTNGPMDQQTDERIHPLIESLVRD